MVRVCMLWKRKGEGPSPFRGDRSQGAVPPVAMAMKGMEKKKKKPMERAMKRGMKRGMRGMKGMATAMKTMKAMRMKGMKGMKGKKDLGTTPISKVKLWTYVPHKGGLTRADAKNCTENRLENKGKILLTKVLVPDGQKKLADSTAILSAKWLGTYRKKVLQPQLKKLRALQAKFERDVAKITMGKNMGIV